MNRQLRVQPTSGMWGAAWLALCLVASGQAFSAVITIDDMTVTQGSSAAPAVIDCNTAGGEVTNAIYQPGSSANLYGEHRVLGLTHTGGNGPCSATYVDAGVPPLWAVRNDAASTGWGRIVWSGADTIGAFALLPLNLSLLQHFNIVYVSADHDTSFFMQVWSGPNNCSQATMVDYPSGGGSDNNLKVPKANFTTPCAANPANFAAITEIRIFFDPFLEIDTQLRGVSAVTENPPKVNCGYKRINGQTNLTVTTPPPYDLTVEFQVDNTAQSPSPATNINVQDYMPAGMTYVGPTTCTPAFYFTTGDPTGLPGGPLGWTSTSQLAAGSSVICSFQAQLNSLDVDQTKTNVLRAKAKTDLVWPPEECQASITRRVAPPPPNGVPAANEWGMLLFTILLGATGYLATRKRGA